MYKAPLPATAIAILVGLMLGEVFSYLPITVSLGLLLFLGFCGATRQGQRVSIPLLLVGAAGFVVSQWIATPIFLSDLRQYVDRGPLHLIAQVSGPPRHYPDRVMLPMEGVALQTARGLQPVRGHFRLTFYQTNATPFEYGDRLALQAPLRAPLGFRNPGVFDYAAYRRRLGESGTMGLRHIHLAQKVGEGGWPILRRLYRFRDGLRRHIADTMDGAPAAIFMAMLIGETGGLSDPIRDVFSASGVTHLLSVSGSHLAFVSLLVFGGVRQCLLLLPTSWLLRLSLRRIPSQCAALITMGPLVFYAFLAGGEVATLRSLTMILVHLAAIWIGRADDVKTSLALAALILLAIQPQAVFDLSFQFSFISVLAIVLTVTWWRAIHPTPERGPEPSRITKYLIAPGRSMLLAGVGATVAATPLTLYYFHAFSWVGLIANLIAIPIAGILIVPLGLLSVAAVPFLSHPTFPLAALHQRLGALFFDLLAFFAQQPGADAHFAAPHWIVVVLFYAVIGFLLARRASVRQMAVAVAAGFLFFLGWGGVRLAPDTLRMTFLDVGQGDATLIEFSDGAVVLVDAGSGGGFEIGRMAVAPALWERRIRTLDAVIGTHPQQDHMGGLISIIPHFNPRQVWTNGMGSDADFYRTLRQHLRQKDLNERHAHRGIAPIEIGGCRLTFLNPSVDLPSQTRPNDRSVVFRLACPARAGGGAGFSLLMTGDIEQEAERRLVQSGAMLRSDVLKVPHHGSRGALDAAFLSAVSPRIAVVSAGRRNRYGHPHPEGVAAYREQAALYRTDQDGAVRIEAAPGGPEVRVDRDVRIRPVRWDATLAGQEWENVRRALLRF